MMSSKQKVAIIGVGLLGGSLALAFKKHKGIQLVGWNHRASSRRKAAKLLPRGRLDEKGGTNGRMDNWNAVEFAKEAQKVIEDLRIKKKKLIIVGGAGFYLKALVEGAPAGPAPSPEIRSMVAEKVKEMGNEKAHSWLMERDLLAANRLHPNDTQRVCRALEKTYSPRLDKSEVKPLGVKKVQFFGLERSRENLDKLLMERAKAMWEKGLLDETKKLVKAGIQEGHPLWGAIGYAEAAAYSRGETTQAEALERIFRRTRQYAKRQWTWFKHQHDVHWINLDDFSDILQVVDLLEKKIAN